MAAIPITFADLSDQQLHQLAGLVPVQHAGLDRAGLMAILAANIQRVGDDLPVAGMNAPMLRNLCAAQGLASGGTRASMATRLNAQANPINIAPVPPAAPAIPPEERALADPKEIKITELKITSLNCRTGSTPVK